TSLDANVGDEASAAVADRLVTALEPALQLQLLDLLGLAALELSDQLPSGHAELRVAGRDARLVFVDDPGGPRAEAAPTDDTASDASTARLTLRMPESLKTAVEQAADAAGQSTNAWLVLAVRRALDSPKRRKRPIGNRLSGYAQT
ncbi:MAG: hypothetical protein WAN48_01980, partial [Actinomycetes bacterium]